MEFIKDFLGVPNGEIYPREYRPGEECPPELEAAARELGALEAEAGAGDMTAAEMRGALDAKGIAYKASASKAELAELLSGAKE